MQDLLLSFLVGMVGGDIAHQLAKDNQKIRLTFPILIVIFSVIFSGIYLLGLGFFIVAWLIKGYPILWQQLGVFSLVFAVLVSVLLALFDRFKH